jgi:hypothetical protein
MRSVEVDQVFEETAKLLEERIQKPSLEAS